MSWTFSTALIRRTGTPGAMKKALCRALREQMGFIPATADNASAEAVLYTRRGQNWMALTSRDILPGEAPEQECETLRGLAAAMKTVILAFFNYMSDVLIIGVTDGTRSQLAFCGYRDALEEYGLPTENGDLSLFDALLADDGARAAFREIIASEPVFSEEICGQVGGLMGFSDDLVLIDGEQAPYAALTLAKAEGGAAFLMPAGAPPAFADRCQPGGGQFSNIDVFSRGGAGHGVAVTVEALDFNADDWEIPVMALFPPGESIPQRSQNACRAVPERIVFPASGNKGWRWLCPDCPIDRGINPERDEPFSRKVQDYDFIHGIILYLTFLPKPGIDPRPFDLKPATIPGRGMRATLPIGRVRFTFCPMENLSGGTSVEYAVHSYTPNPHPSADSAWWAGEYGGILREWAMRTYGHY